MTSSALRVAASLLILATALASLSGCATRTVRHSILKRNTIQVDLIREVRGFSTEEKGYEHPGIVSVPRLMFILGALEIEIAADGTSVVRQPAIHKEILKKTAEALADGLAQASPDEAVAMNVIRKEARLGVFHRKYLTNFLAHMDNGQLYLSLRRVDWPVPKAMTDEELPDPARGRRAMDFRVVTGEPIYFAGPQDLEIDWQSDAFRKIFRLPGTTKGEKRRRSVISSSPIPKEEFKQKDEGVSLDDLTPDQLRALATLEEDRREGRITESVYQRERRQLLRQR